MIKKLLLSFLLLGFSSSLFACGNYSTVAKSEVMQNGNIDIDNSQNSSQVQSADEEAILGILEQISKASVAKDVKALDAILPDNYVLVHMTGYRQAKDEWLEEVANASMEYFDNEDNSTSEQIVSIKGDTATVSSKGTVEAKIGVGGKRRTWNISSTATFKKINGQWVIQETDATK